MPIGNQDLHEPALPARADGASISRVIPEQASPPPPSSPSPPPRLVVHDDLVAVWRVACAAHAVAWRNWLTGAGSAVAVLAALNREESAARALASFHQAGV
ncbi:hypothetical protein DSM104299_00516 [Baekduia alba]|uniref:hypothetical protein n=1 Tax=Baekduia alba TaxID=2997333 RepID=UPI0023406CAD|nr:hypothetical protein [Baekduia alba]WCB91838.1 hypothetical protein DSM104299_00516 [Baekduia alba]